MKLNGELTLKVTRSGIIAHLRVDSHVRVVDSLGGIVDSLGGIADSHGGMVDSLENNCNLSWNVFKFVPKLDFSFVNSVFLIEKSGVL